MDLANPEVINDISEVCERYQQGDMSALLFDNYISSYASCFAEPLLSRVLKRVERTVGEHRCFFWNACRDACAFEGNEDFWAENIRDVDPFFTTVESETVN